MHNTTLLSDLRSFTETVAVPGYEDNLAAKIMAETKSLHPQKDALGNITITIGSGAPHRLIAVPMDEPGYVVSKIEDDGYLRVQRTPTGGLPLHYNEMLNAQPVLVGSQMVQGKMLPAIVAGQSIHLTPGRKNIPDPDDIDNMYIDIGAKSAAEVRRAGVDNLSPIAAERHLLPLGEHEWTATAVGDRFGAAAALELLRALSAGNVKGTVTVAFVTQQWSGGRGLATVLHATKAEELIYIGRAMAPLPVRNAVRQSGRRPVDELQVYRAKTGTGVYIATNGNADIDATFANELKAAATAEHVKIGNGFANTILPASYGSAVTVPARTTHLAIPLAWPTTGAEALDDSDLTALVVTLEHYLTGAAKQPSLISPVTVAYPASPAKPAVAPSSEAILKSLILSYGVSEDEGRVRDTVQALLPSWAKPTVDGGGNIVLHLGKPGSKPGIIIMAHTDELGWRVKEILPDGMLALENKGGGSASFFWGHPELIHTESGAIRGGVIALPDNYDTPQFKFVSDIRAGATMYVGAHSAEEVAKLGIKVGDHATIPKDYRSLLGKRANGRSLDDRVGCAALIRAAWMLGPNLNRDVTLVWSTREELGLLGATYYAGEAAKNNTLPATIFAIDTFVSSDSPLESKRFADATIGDGFVIRAMDGSNITPIEDVHKLIALAKKNNVPVQFGATGGGNDGSVYTRYGVVDVALAWPLRYSHSPGEVIDTRDLDALSKISEVVAREW